MNWFEKWFLKQVFKKQVRQGVFHHANIIELYTMIGNAARDEFHEDNDPTLKHFLKECFDSSLNNIKKAASRW